MKNIGEISGPEVCFAKWFTIIKCDVTSFGLGNIFSCASR